MIDFNNAEHQKEGAVGPVPEDSVVILQMTLRPAKPGKTTAHPLVAKSGKGNEYLNAEFYVFCGTYKGAKLWQNFTISGSETASKITMRTLRAIIEAHRMIRLDDNSPEACQKRVINDWSDLNGMIFPAVVGLEWSEPSAKDGKQYLNNTVKKIVTPEDERNATLGEAGEIISAKPLPTEPPTVTGAKPTGAWGATASAPPASASPAPAWAAKPDATPAAPMAPAPATKPAWIK